MRTILLNNGEKIPVLGLGASIITRPKDGEGRDAIAQRQKEIYYYAFKKYPGLLFDTSSSYGLNETILGEAIREANARGKVFLAVKISNHEQRQGDIRKAVEQHLNVLGTDYIDLLMLHWPHPGTFVDSYKQMENLYREGYANSIGVSNFHQHHLQQLMKTATVVPVVNQIEVHPLFTQKPLIDYCKNMGIRVVSYTPLARMHDVLYKNKTLRRLATKYKKTAPQIILRWNIEKGLVPIPRTLSPEHLDEFMNIFDFRLTNEEIKAMNEINENIRLRFNPDTVDYNMV